VRATLSRFSEFLYLDDVGVASLSRSGSEDTDEQGKSPASNPEHAFRRLWQLIESEESPASSRDANSGWESAADRTFCMLDGRLSVPSLIAALSVSAELNAFVQLGQQAGFIPVSGGVAETAEQFAALHQLIHERFPAVLGVEGSPTSVVLWMDIEQCRVPVSRFAGSVTVYGRIIEHTPKGESLQLIPIPGLAQVQAVNRAERRRRGRAAVPPGAKDLEVEGPALTLRVLAVVQ
jgi:hypothetical protein